MQELDEEIKLHNAGGEDAPDTSDVSALFWIKKDHRVFVTFQIILFSFSS